MAVRDFNGTTDVITFSAGGVAMGFGSMWAVCRPDSVTANQGIVVTANGVTNRCRLMIDSSSVVRAQFGATQSLGTTTLSTGRWYFLGWSKATGSNAPRMHILDYSTGTWTHENGGTAAADATTTTDSILIGSSAGGSQFFDGRVIAAAIKQSVVLSDSEFETLGNWHMNNWHGGGQGVDWFVKLDQAATTDSISDRTGGGGNQSAITGTSIGTESHPLT